jgi:hypothetical protein
VLTHRPYQWQDWEEELKEVSWSTSYAINYYSANKSLLRTSKNMSNPNFENKFNNNDVIF